MSQYVELWKSPGRGLVEGVCSEAFEVSVELADKLLGQFPALLEVLKAEVKSLLEGVAEDAHALMLESIYRELDPFTLNEFLELRVNKIRLERFSQAVDKSFEGVKGPGGDWKEEVFKGLGAWYRNTHCGTLCIIDIC